MAKRSVQAKQVKNAPNRAATNAAPDSAIPAKRSPGRPTLFTPERIKIILDTIKIGGSEADACAKSGIQESTLEAWKTSKAGFLENIQKARMEGKVARIERIATAGVNGHWQADAWYLERRFPAEFAQSYIIKVTGEQAALLKKFGLTPGQAFEEMIRELANANAGT